MSSICAGFDLQMQFFLRRPLEASGYAHLYRDAMYFHCLLGRAMQVFSRVVMAAMVVNANRRSELLGLEVGDSERKLFCSEVHSLAQATWPEWLQAAYQCRPQGSYQG